MITFISPLPDRNSANKWHLRRDIKVFFFLIQSHLNKPVRYLNLPDHRCDLFHSSDVITLAPNWVWKRGCDLNKVLKVSCVTTARAFYKKGHYGGGKSNVTFILLCFYYYHYDYYLRSADDVKNSPWGRLNLSTTAQQIFWHMWQMLITCERETGTFRWHFPRKHRAKHIFPGAGYYYRGYRCFGTRRENLLQPASINHFYSGAPV